MKSLLGLIFKLLQSNYKALARNTKHRSISDRDRGTFTPVENEKETLRLDLIQLIPESYGGKASWFHQIIRTNQVNTSFANKPPRGGTLLTGTF